MSFVTFGLPSRSSARLRRRDAGGGGGARRNLVARLAVGTSRGGPRHSAAARASFRSGTSLSAIWICPSSAAPCGGTDNPSRSTTQGRLRRATRETTADTLSAPPSYQASPAARDHAPGRVARCAPSGIRRGCPAGRPRARIAPRGRAARRRDAGRRPPLARQYELAVLTRDAVVCPGRQSARPSGPRTLRFASASSALTSRAARAGTGGFRGDRLPSSWRIRLHDPGGRRGAPAPVRSGARLSRRRGVVAGAPRDPPIENMDTLPSWSRLRARPHR